MPFGIKAAAPLRFAAALQGASRIFMHSGERMDDEICALQELDALLEELG